MDSEIVGLYHHNPTKKIGDLAADSGVSVGNFYRILQKYGVEPSRIGNRNNIVHDYQNNGHNVAAIANLTGYTPRNVRYILSKKK